MSGPVNGSWVAAAGVATAGAGATAGAVDVAATAGRSDEAATVGGVTVASLVGAGTASGVAVVLVVELLDEELADVASGSSVVVVVVQPHSAMALLEIVGESPDAPQATPPMAAPKATVTMVALSTAVILLILASFSVTARPAIPTVALGVSRRSTTGVQ